ncbi:helix-turn-helix domain-containing protein [Flavobacterium sp. XS2P24]|uniref:helix-turn-helix domain-containing protein n=1 Tax=Flavobacterium sp. XS2P24 TaxID=3041249 RepID=UPI0024A818A7|nr:helix-turn-helix domain-containing protein [Flavobacterium sp. XS2P24]MDI6050645.1 helix-turn-helix domain-containing protein [Flavobacterium sp. XS2P24]
MPFYEPNEKTFLEIKEQLKDLKAILTKSQLLNPDDLFCDNEEFLKIMKISRRTSQFWRNTGIIGFIQIGNKIYFRLKDIQELLNKNYKPGNKK